MKIRKIRWSQTFSMLIRTTAVAAAAITVGVFGAQAAEPELIPLSEDICLSCAYADGLPRSSGPAATRRAAGVEIDGATTAAPESDEASFATSSTIRSRITLPASPGERLRWSASEKALMWSFVSLSTIDAYQTMNAPAHVAEANPLLASWAGDHPSQLETVAFKGLTTYALIKLLGRVKKRGTRRTALALMNIVQLSVAAHNERVSDGIVF